MGSIHMVPKGLFIASCATFITLAETLSITRKSKNDGRDGEHARTGQRLVYEVWKLATLATLLKANSLSAKNWQQNWQQIGNSVATTGKTRVR